MTTILTTEHGGLASPETFAKLPEDELRRRIAAAKEVLGEKLLILGHHYQRDEVIAVADLTGDSLKLARLAAENTTCQYIVFCGVHFMAETADILTPDHVAVVLPDLAAGCSMADMADLDQVEECWETLGGWIDVDDVLPVTYVNSTADLKAFCGQRGGIVCTSSNAAKVLEWAWTQRSRVLFFPDQHLGRNTAKAMGVPLDEMVLWDPAERDGGLDAEAARRARVILWQGFCSVHQVFTPAHVKLFRQRYPDIQVMVHPECAMEVVDLADGSGSTEAIIRAVDEAPAGSTWAIGTELNLVNRLTNRYTDKQVFYLSSMACMCATMYRIDLPHLAWALENVVAGRVVNQIRVPPETAEWAKVALERMLAVV